MAAAAPVVVPAVVIPDALELELFPVDNLGFKLNDQTPPAVTRINKNSLYAEATETNPVPIIEGMVVDTFTIGGKTRYNLTRNELLNLLKNTKDSGEKRVLRFVNLRTTALTPSPPNASIKLDLEAMDHTEKSVSFSDIMDLVLTDDDQKEHKIHTLKVLSGINDGMEEKDKVYTLACYIKNNSKTLDKHEVIISQKDLAGNPWVKRFPKIDRYNLKKFAHWYYNTNQLKEAELVLNQDIWEEYEKVYKIEMNQVEIDANAVLWLKFGFLVLFIAVIVGPLVVNNKIDYEVRNLYEAMCRANGAVVVEFKNEECAYNCSCCLYEDYAASRKRRCSNHELVYG